MRRTFTYTCTNIDLFTQKLIAFCQNQNFAIALLSNNYKDIGSKFKVNKSSNLLAAIGTLEPSFYSLKTLKENPINDWLFGWISYDVKNEIEPLLHSSNPDTIGFDTLFFCVPKFVLEVENSSVKIHAPQSTDSEEVDALFKNIENITTALNTSLSRESFAEARVSKTTYMEVVKNLKSHIKKGDIYEVNYCIEFFGKEKNLNPAETFLKLNAISPTPFAAFVKSKSHFLMSASPERYLKKEGDTLLSQPIKGTIKRGKTPNEDEMLKNCLLNNPKEQSENIMITDLVRNDLSKVAKRGTVEVNELMGLYSYPQVHQLVSTVSAKIESKTCWVDAIKATFPMGSMTGAPKLKAMELIDKYEASKRGLYSGAVGYIDPTGDFDFNVVIRSLLYNQKTANFSFMVGSAITANSDAELEYEECLLKASAIIKAANLKINPPQ